MSYSVGTLRYTLGGLVTVFFWLLFADFTFVIMESVTPRLVPLELKDLHASNALIGLLTTGIGGIINVLLLPVISYRSDRHRSPRGRRIPYLTWPSPFIAISLVWIGISPDLGQWLHRVAVRSTGMISVSSLIIVILALAIISFQYFNLYVFSVYYYLIRDVVPAGLMGRFYGMFRVVGAGGAFIFNRWILALGGEPELRKWIYIGAGLLYLASFALLCWNVREGDYPPPEDDHASGFLPAARKYVRECYSVPEYWCYFGVSTCYVTATACYTTFSIFFAESLGLSIKSFGNVMSWTFVLGVLFYYPFGWLADRKGAIRINLLAFAGLFVAASVGGCVIRGPITFWYFTMLFALAQIVYLASAAPLDLAILPADRYGQFASAAGIVRSLAIVVAGYAGGAFIDIYRHFRPSDAYRALYWWAACFAGIGFLFLARVYELNRRPGGFRLSDSDDRAAAALHRTLEIDAEIEPAR